MRRPLAVLALLLAWLCAQGAAMDAVQVFAWARMFSGYTRFMSWSDAVAATFDPAKPCEICGAIKTAREAEERSPETPASPEVAKVVLFATAEEVVVAPALMAPHGVSWNGVASEWTAAVPTPPPRRVVT